MSLEGNTILKDLTSRTMEKELGSLKASVVDFWAPWCVPCKRMLSVLEEVARESSEKYRGQIGFFRVNVDQESSLAQKFEVMTVPTILGFSGTVPLDRFNGKSKEDLQKWVDKLAERFGL